MKATLWLVRHARPDVGDGICYGQTDLSVQASANAVAARQLAQTLANERKHPRQRYRVYTSGLARADELALALQVYFPELNIERDPRLQEMNFGKWEMCRWNDVPKAEIDHWIAHFGTYRFGGVESCQDVLSRVILAYQDLQLTLTQGEEHDEDVQILWITHAGVIRALSYFLATGSRCIHDIQQWPIDAPGFGEWRRLSIVVNAASL